MATARSTEFQEIKTEAAAEDLANEAKEQKEAIETQMEQQVATEQQAAEQMVQAALE